MAGMAKLDVTAENAMLDATDEWGVYQFVRSGTDGVNVYCFFINASSELTYRKSTNSGRTWGSQVVIEATDAYISVSVWFDQWTIGDTTGNTIHIAACDSTNDECTYFSLGVDDDLAETNNNVVIDTANTVINPGASGHVTICKGKGGSLYVGYSATTTAGFYLFESEDSGATWAAITAGTNPTDSLSAALDCGHLFPLDTDNDIILFGHASGGKNIAYWIWDDVGESWSARTEFSRNAGSTKYTTTNFCQKKSNADIYMVSTNDSLSFVGFNAQKFDESIRSESKDGAGTLFGFNMTNSLFENSPFKIDAMACSVDDDTGQLILVIMFGEGGDTTRPWVLSSSDEGKHWSCPAVCSGEDLADDFKRIYMTPHFKTNDNIQLMALNEDLNDIVFRAQPFQTGGSVTGVVKDNSGSTVSGAVVRAYMEGRYDECVGAIDPYAGETISDGSGNYTIYLPPKYTIFNKGTRNVFTRAFVGEDHKTLPFWKPDLTTALTLHSAGIATVNRDTANDELDYQDPGDGITDQISWTWENLSAKTGWTIDFKLDIDTITQDSATLSKFIVCMDSSANITSPGQNFGLLMTVATAIKKFTAFHNDNDNANTTSYDTESDFATEMSVGTFYIRMGMSDFNKFKIGIFSDATFETLTESEEITIAQTFVGSTGTAGLDNFIVGSGNLSHTNVHTGSISNIRFYREFYDDVNSPTGGTADTVDVSHVVDEV